MVVVVVVVVVAVEVVVVAAVVLVEICIYIYINLALALAPACAYQVKTTKEAINLSDMSSLKPVSISHIYIKIHTTSRALL